MAETQMIPFNSDCCGWGDAVPAFGGALIGSLFTNGGFDSIQLYHKTVLKKDYEKSNYNK